MVSSRCYPQKAPKVDKLLDTLSNKIQREVIHYFENFADDDSASIDQVVSHIDDRVPSTTPEELRAKLHHTHLPRLKERGWVDYDTRNGDIRYQGHDDAEQLLTELLAVFKG